MQNANDIDLEEAFSVSNPDGFSADFYDRVTALPDPRQGRRDQLKVMLAIGGWTDSTGSKYSDLVSDAAKRAAFAASAVAFLRRHNFRGLQVDWNYPKCWHSDCRKGPASDKPNFSKLIQVSATVLSSDTVIHTVTGL